jgi:tetratricopeptide (TPR) repeat protein
MFREFSQNSDAPVTRFEQMLKTNQVYFFDALEFETIIQFYIDTGEINLAKKALQMGINQHPFQIDLLLLKSELLIFDDANKEALQLLDTIEELEPSNQEIYIQKATIFSKGKNNQAAIELLFKGLEQADDPHEIWSLLAMEYMVIGNYTEAKNYFRLCIEEDPEDYQILYNLLFCLDYLKENSEALDVLNQILETNPYNEIAWLESGKQYLILNKKEEALSAFDFAIISEDTFTGAYIEKAKLLEDIGRKNEAIENYEIAARLEDSSAYLNIRIASCHAHLGNDQLALQYFKKGINEDPSYEKAWTGIIDFYISKQNSSKALYYCDKALQINENYVSYWKRSALLNKDLGKYQEAEIAFQSTIELGNYELLVWTGWLDTLIFLNEWDKGQTIAQQAKEFYPEEQSLDFKIAGCYHKMGKTIEMEYYLQNVKSKYTSLPKEVLDLFPQLIQLLQ